MELSGERASLERSSPATRAVSLRTRPGATSGCAQSLRSSMRLFMYMALMLSPVLTHEAGPTLSHQQSNLHGRSDGRMLSKIIVSELSPLAEQKIAQYKSGEGLIVNVHITHHAGTTLCNWARANGPTPNFGKWGRSMPTGRLGFPGLRHSLPTTACMQPRPPQTSARVPVLSGEWKNETLVQQVRNDFHFIASE